MTQLSSLGGTLGRRVLVGCGRGVAGSFLCQVGAELRLRGVLLCRAYSSSEVGRFVEEGGLAGAVVMADRREMDGLSVVQIIRSVDRKLPCWLITQETSSRTMRAAMALSVNSVLPYPLEVEELTGALGRVLWNTMLEN